MTEAEFIAAWSGANANTRFTNFRAWLFESVSGFSNYLPLIGISQSTTGSTLSEPSPGQFVVPSAFFQDATPDRAVNAGRVIENTWYQMAMEAHNKWQKEKEEYEKDYKKQREKELDKLLKDSKPKGSKAGYGDYLYYKKMKELEYGSG